MRWRCCCCSVSESCPTVRPHARCLCPLLSPGFVQIHVHWISDTIQHLILCHPLLLLPSVFPSIRVFSSESVLHVRWPKYRSFSFSISPSKGDPGLIYFRIGLLSLQSKGLSAVFSGTTIWKHQFFSAQPSLWSISHIHAWLLEKL